MTWPPVDLPYLTPENCRETSLPTPRYNCIAWAAGENFRWWWPDPYFSAYWPSLAPREITIQAFEAAFALLGYRSCSSGELEEALEKVALYGIIDSTGAVSPTHAARQLVTGEWTSKLGRAHDISHENAEDVRSQVYGSVVSFMARPRPLA